MKDLPASCAKAKELGGAKRLPVWSPDGKRIMFSADDDVASVLFVMNADGSNLRSLTATR